MKWGGKLKGSSRKIESCWIKKRNSPQEADGGLIDETGNAWRKTRKGVTGLDQLMLSKQFYLKVPKLIMFHGNELLRADHFGRTGLA
jgi:hypothetical protein